MGYDRSDEDEAERLDRNYSELLQELRVAQTGVQVLFAFLLGIAFQQRFGELQWYQRGFYLFTLVAAAISAVLLIAPAAAHRQLFRHHLKDELVALTSRLAATGLFFLAVSVLSAVFFVLDVVINLSVAGVVAGLLLLVLGTLWYVVPLLMRHRHPAALIENDPRESESKRDDTARTDDARR